MQPHTWLCGRWLTGRVLFYTAGAPDSGLCGKTDHIALASGDTRRNRLGDHFISGDFESSQVMIGSAASRYRLALIVIILAGFFLRIRTLALNPLWFDEAIEYWVATAPLDELLPAVKGALQDPPLYSLLLHFWMALGRDEFMLGLLSTFVAVLAIVTAYALGAHAHSRGAGLVAAYFFAVLPPQIRFAQEAGQYAILSFTLLANLLAMSYARQNNEWKYWIAWIITALLCVYSHYGSLLVIIAVAASVFLENAVKRRETYLARQAAATISMIALALPLILGWLPDQLFRGQTRSAFDIPFDALPAVVDSLLVRTQQLLRYQFTGHIADPDLLASLGVVALALLLLALLLSFYSLFKFPDRSYLVVWLLYVWVAYYAAGRLGAYPYGGTRHALILAPLLILCAAIGIATSWRMRRVLALVLMVGITFVTAVMPRDAPEDVRTLVDRYLARREANTPAYVYYNAVPGFRYQLQQQTGLKADLPAGWYQQCWAGEAEPYCAEDNVFYGRWIRALSPRDKSDEIFTAVEAAVDEDFWIFFSHTPDVEQEDVLKAIAERFTVIEKIEATGASAYLFRQR